LNFFFFTGPSKFNLLDSAFGENLISNTRAILGPFTYTLYSHCRPPQLRIDSFKFNLRTERESPRGSWWSLLLNTRMPLKFEEMRRFDSSRGIEILWLFFFFGQWPWALASISFWKLVLRSGSRWNFKYVQISWVLSLMFKDAF
jgi:hypothetical protein